MPSNLIRPSYTGTLWCESVVLFFRYFGPIQYVTFGDLFFDYKPVDCEEHLIGASKYCSGNPNKLNWALESRVLGMCYDKG